MKFFGALDLVLGAMVPTLVGASAPLTAVKVDVAFASADSRCWPGLAIKLPEKQVIDRVTCQH